jgi:hypothetical protein
VTAIWHSDGNDWPRGHRLDATDEYAVCQTRRNAITNRNVADTPERPCSVVQGKMGISSLQDPAGVEGRKTRLFYIKSPLARQKGLTDRAMRSLSMFLDGRMSRDDTPIPVPPEADPSLF